MKYQVDLNTIENDRLKITLQVPNIYRDTLVFQFPAIIPGHYSWVNYGRFVDSLVAFNRQGDTLEVKKLDTNKWEIISDGNLNIIQYEINDTQDAEVQEKVRPWSATNFKEDHLFVFNNGGVFGFFEDYEELDYDIILTIPDNLYVSTSLPYVEKNKTYYYFKQKITTHSLIALY